MSAVWTLIDLLAGRRDPATLGDWSWEAVISVARAEALAATLAEQLVDAEVPPQIAALFADMRTAAKVQQNAALWEAEMARRALEPIGVRFVLLKGTAYAAAGLPNAAGRQIGDLDILVARDDLARAEAALIAAGWEWVKSNPYDDAYYRDHMHELPPLIHRDRDRMIDVHHTILPLTHRARPDAGAMLAASKSAHEGEGLMALSPADMAVHCAAHVMADGDLAGGLRNVYDFHHLAGGRWDEVMARARHHGLHAATARAARLAHRLYGTTAPAELQRLTISDRLFLRALTARDDWGRPTRPFTRLAFYIRSHWLRMPPLMLARHLWTKWRKG
jgi:Uncharacterised nucleotidyltransferase